jgi:hypothetical protein
VVLVFVDDFDGHLSQDLPQVRLLLHRKADGVAPSVNTKTLVKFGAVLAGYVTTVLVASAAVAVRIASALLFLLGNHLIGWYLAATSVTSVYGAAGSIVIVLLWVYYSSQVVLFGAEFTRVYAKRRGAPLEPKENAVRINRQEHA